MKTDVLFASLVLFLLGCLPVGLAAPGYPLLENKPPPGESGVQYDKSRNTLHTYYGNRELPGHMEHLMYNQRKHPENNRPFSVAAAGNKDNRKKAFAGTNPRPGFVRDEKPPNSMIHNPKTTTLRSLPKAESDREWQLLSTTTKKARASGAKVQLHANPSTDYKGRSARSLSRSGSRSPGPSSRRTPSPRPPWNAGPGRRASSAPPARGRQPARNATPRSSSRSPPRGRPPTRNTSPSPPRSRSSSSQSRSSSPRNARQRASSAPPPRGRPPTRNPSSARSSRAGSPRPPMSRKAQGKQPLRNSPGPARRTPPRNATPGPSRPSRGRTPSPNRSPAKPAWNAGPGRRNPSPPPPPRRSTRLATQPPKPPPAKPQAPAKRKK